MKPAICYLALAILFAATVSADVIHVPGDYPTIQAGINAAVNGDTVLVADGTYTGTGNKDIDFTGKAIVVMSENGAENCIIDCEDVGRGFTFHSGEYSSSVLVGFTVTNGSVSYGGGIYCYIGSNPTIKNCTLNGNSAERRGGGIYCLYSSPVISECAFRYNYSEDHGGGIYCGSSNATINDCEFFQNHAEYRGGGISCYYSSPTIENCTISGNSASDDGGGIFCYYGSSPIIEHCTINGNSASNGGGIACYSNSSPTIENCSISGNSADEGGGGIQCIDYSSPDMSNCIISGNSVDEGGGGIQCWYSNPTIDNCTISGNSAVWGGGGISCSWYSSPTISNCTFSENSAVWDGGGIHCHRSSPTISNCTISGNSAYYGGGICSSWDSCPSGVNNIIWGNTALNGSQIYLDTGGSFSCTYSDIQGGWPGTGNIFLDPEFVDTTWSDHRLQWGSPCIDAGDPNPIYNDPDGTVADMGAFYYDQSMPLRVLLTPHDTPIQIPIVGGSFDYTIRLTNIAPLVLVAEVWCDATLPNGHIYGPVLGPVSVDIGSGVTRSRERTQNVPAGAPVGTYSYNAYATAGSDTSTDSFTFFKEGADGGYLGSPSDWICTGEPFTSEEMVSIRPSEFILLPSHPNPFNPETKLTFALSTPGDVSLIIYDIQGREVARLVDGWRAAGTHQAVFDGSGLASGMYFARLTAGDFQRTRKLLLVK